jgi:hypothetical protein
MRKGDTLTLVRARIYLVANTPPICAPHFISGSIEAGQWDIPQNELSIEEVIERLISADGLRVDELGYLKLAQEQNAEAYIAPPTLLHPEGLNTGSRLAILIISGANYAEYVPQPETDWLLKSATAPYDSINELCVEYDLGALRGDRSTLEIVARTAIEVWANSAVRDGAATLGIWMANSLDKFKARIGYRVVVKGRVENRGSVSSDAMTWTDDGAALTGLTHLTVPVGSIVQCFATYDNHTHHMQWRADPSVFQNPRAALLSMANILDNTLREYIDPGTQPRGRAADDFEAAIGWLLWALGFSPALFGTNAKTRDVFDIAAVTPLGDFLVVECTLGLLKADSKLSTLQSRSANLRSKLDSSDMKHIRVLPVIVTALSKEQVVVDVPQAEQHGILVLTKQNLDNALIELLRLPDANSLYETAWQIVQDKKTHRINSSKKIEL